MSVFDLTGEESIATYESSIQDIKAICETFNSICDKDEKLMNKMYKQRNEKQYKKGGDGTGYAGQYTESLSSLASVAKANYRENDTDNQIAALFKRLIKLFQSSTEADWSPHQLDTANSLLASCKGLLVILRTYLRNDSLLNIGSRSVCYSGLTCSLQDIYIYIYTYSTFYML